MLNFLGTLGANALGLPGILGCALGMLTRRPWLGALFGIAVGLFETLLFADWNFAAIAPLELFMAICVGGAAGVVGSSIRVFGAKV